MLDRQAIVCLIESQLLRLETNPFILTRLYRRYTGTEESYVMNQQLKCFKFEHYT